VPFDEKSTIRDLSDGIVSAQAELRVLDSVKWDDGVRQRFDAAGGREQPDVDEKYYARRPLSFDPADLKARFFDLEAEISSKLGAVSPTAVLMKRNCENYRLAIDLIEARGSAAFGSISNLLYGTADEAFHLGGPNLIDFAELMETALSSIEPSLFADAEPHQIPGADAVGVLQQRLDDSMGPGLVDVKVDDGIVADAAAGSSYVKLRADATFSERDLALLEAHEGWVHVGTTQNGLAQPVCTFLGKAPPPTVVTQEGLAVLTEIFSQRSHPSRLRRIVNRVRGVQWAAEGASFLEVRERFRTNGLDEDEAWQTTSRVFRGSTATGPPFTKDLAYGKGLVLTYVYVRLCVRMGQLDRIPMLFCGKVDLRNLGTLGHLLEEGLVEAPRFVPPPFRDLHALSTTVAFSRFLNELDFDRLETDYSRVL
jgi:uncharacterized protein (TIGR02421 family)